jgi:hypothetical protein
VHRANRKRAVVAAAAAATAAAAGNARAAVQGGSSGAAEGNGATESSGDTTGGERPAGAGAAESEGAGSPNSGLWRLIMQRAGSNGRPKQELSFVLPVGAAYVISGEVTAGARVLTNFLSLFFVLSLSLSIRLG